MPKLAALLALYFAQGLPFGFQATALPLLLRERGVSLEAIGFASLLSLPWLAKALWAPLVDRYGSARFGRRKSWIVPMQAGLVLAALLAARADDMRTLASLILLMNLFAATQDIAVDALALSVLSPSQLGPANAIQVVGYKLGMLTGGGLLVWASARIGWNGLFFAIALLMGVVLLIALGVREPASSAGPDPKSEPGAPPDTRPEHASEPGHEQVSLTPELRFRAIARQLRDALRSPATLALMLIVVSYKSGEALADGMWKPMLLDRGFSVAQIGLWAGTFGMTFSLLGSTASGFVARRVPLARALVAIALLRALGVAGEWWISHTPDASAASVIAVTCVEHLFGGAITTILFALMMRHTVRAIGATHYTLLASLEVLGKLPLTAVSGIVAARFGYEALFAMGTGLCLGFSALARALERRLA